MKYKTLNTGNNVKNKINTTVMKQAKELKSDYEKKKCNWQ